MYESDDWGEYDEDYEQDSYDQEPEHDLWDTEDAPMEEEDHEAYIVEQQGAGHDNDAEALNDSDDQDEDDQGNYD